MSANVRLPRPVMILADAAAMMRIGMGMRQSPGLFLPPVRHDLALKAADFPFAVGARDYRRGKHVRFLVRRLARRSFIPSGSRNKTA
jgi:hypothetical protein